MSEFLKYILYGTSFGGMYQILDKVGESVYIFIASLLTSTPM